MKRFTETTKWADPWFRKLPPVAKLLWQYLCDTCDQAGVIELDEDIAAFVIGGKLPKDWMSHFAGRVEVLGNGKLRILKFIQFQYGKLSRGCKPHIPVFAALERHGLAAEDVPQNASYKNTVDEGLRQRVIDRDGMICAYSGLPVQPEEVVIDHIFPRKKGGTATMDNLVVASIGMNSLKSDLHVLQFISAVQLDETAVLERLSKRTGKPIEEFMESFEAYLGRLKEKEKEKEKGIARELYPPELQTDAFIAAWERWVQHLRERGKGMGDVQRDAVWRECVQNGAARAVLVIGACIKAGYKHLYWDIKLDAPVVPAAKRVPNYKTQLERDLDALQNGN